MTKKQRVAAIIASGKTCFTAASQATLEQLPDAELEALEKHIKAASDPAPEPAPEPAPAPTPGPEPAKDDDEEETPEQRREKLLKENPDISEIVTEHKAAQAAKRTALVSQLKDAQKAFSEADLTVMPLDQLTKLASAIVKPKSDFSGAGGPRDAGGNVNRPDPPPSLGERIRASRATN